MATKNEERSSTKMFETIWVHKKERMKKDNNSMTMVDVQSVVFRFVCFFFLSETLSSDETNHNKTFDIFHLYLLHVLYLSLSLLWIFFRFEFSFRPFCSSNFVFSFLSVSLHLFSFMLTTQCFPFIRVVPQLCYTRRLRRHCSIWQITSPYYTHKLFCEQRKN